MAWLSVGLNSFGGPAGQIGVMHREIVERRRWISESSFLQGLNFTMLLPGPEAQQLATYLGWRLNGLRGGMAAGLLFILPGVVAIMALSLLYVLYEDTAFVQALFYGIKPAVVAVVLAAVARLASRVLVGPSEGAIATGAFVAIFFFDVPFPIIVAAAAIAGWAARHQRPGPGGATSTGAPPEGQTPSPAAAPHGPHLAHLAAPAALPAPESRAVAATRPPLGRALATLLLAAGVWLLPTVVVVLVAGPESVMGQLVLFFSLAALVTFGGAYAVLAFVAQQAVGGYGWLSAEQMVDGLGMAESTPGPLIMVVQFVGFVAAANLAGPADPVVAGVVAALLVTWVTFVPSFGLIFAGAPYVVYLQGRARLQAALGGITAAVVGVILNLGLWFGLQALFTSTGELRLGPLRLYTVDITTLDPVALGLVVLGLALLLVLRWPLLLTLAVSAGIGFAYHLLAG
jgi:chromate transporter